MGKHKSADLKQAVIQLYQRMPEKSMEKVANVFQLPFETVRRWIRRHADLGTLENQYRGSMSYKVTQEHFDYIKLLITNQKDIYIHELRNKLKERFTDFDISTRHLSRVVKDIPFSKKKWTIRHYPKERYGKELDLERDKEEFFQKLKKYHINDMIALDETSIQLGMSRGKARCYVGQRCIKKTDNNAVFQRFSLLMAISTEKIEGWYLKKGAIQTEDLHKFLKTILSRKASRKLVILDNAPIHKKGTDKYITELGHTSLYVLPYQHYLNPIENFFNQLKHYMKDIVPMNEKEVVEAIKYSIGHIQKKHLRNYFLNAYDPEQLNKRKKPIRRAPNKKYKEVD
jgi:transposase